MKTRILRYVVLAIFRSIHEFGYIGTCKPCKCTVAWVIDRSSRECRMQAVAENTLLSKELAEWFESHFKLHSSVSLLENKLLFF
jgi:hypothetical protein